MSQGDRKQSVYETGSSAARADDAAAAVPGESQPGESRPGEDEAAHEEDLLDEAIEETFPASDPISPAEPPRRR